MEKKKKAFLNENQLFTEYELDEESKPIGKIEDIDLTENEVWFMQCPKRFDVKQLEGQKLKVPGRTTLSESESLCVEFTQGAEQHAFAYFNRKGYNLRLLPVRGTILLRNRLKAADIITPERIEDCCPPFKKVPMPSRIRIRHPLLGVHYEEKLILPKDTVNRLKNADKKSAEVLKHCLIKKETEKRQTRTKVLYENTIPIVVSDGDDDIVNKKKKRKSSLSDTTREEKKKKRKSIKIEDEVSRDLQWLQNI